jgi:hypothetical protein
VLGEQLPNPTQLTRGGAPWMQVWDRRMLGERRRRCAGGFVGHLEGLTHIDSRGDGRYLITNCKARARSRLQLAGAAIDGRRDRGTARSSGN